MARNNKKFGNADQFIAQNLIDFEKPEGKGKIVILAIIGIAIALIGGGVYLFVNKADFEWEFRLPWQSEDDDPIFSIKTKEAKEKEKKEKVELIIPEFYGKADSNNGNLAGCSLKAQNLDYDNKGFKFELVITSKKVVSIEIEKILLDGFPFDIDFNVDEISGEYKGTVRIKQTDLDRYNMIGFKRMNIYYRVYDHSTGEEGLYSYSPGINPKVMYDNTVKGLIEIYNFNTNVVSYYKTESDKDNTYIYFYALNKANVLKKISIKKLIINDKLYDYQDFEAEIYYKAQDIFYLSIPKKKVKEVEKFTLSFFITEVNEQDEHYSAVYLTPDYEKDYSVSK